MSKVQAVECELQKLTPVEIREVRDWLDNFLEDQLQFTAEFEADLQQSERDLAAGISSRSRQPSAVLVTAWSKPLAPTRPPFGQHGGHWFWVPRAAVRELRA